MLRCCVDERRLEFCSDCVEFPCERLQNWAARDEGYGKALARLKGMVKKP